MAKSNYATPSHIQIQKYLSENKDRLVHVGDIDAYLKNAGIQVSPSTIYRYLNQLSKDALLIKYPASKGEMSAFQYVGENPHKCKEHLHLQCTKCGRLIHLECGFMDEIASHIEAHHGFVLQCETSMLYGLCKDCMQ